MELISLSLINLKGSHNKRLCTMMKEVIDQVDQTDNLTCNSEEILRKMKS
jgi:hypothetical protein